LSVEKQWQKSSIDQVQEMIASYLDDDIDRDIFLLRMEIQDDDPEYDEVLAIVSSSTTIRESETRVLADKIAKYRKRPVRLSVITAPLVRSQSLPE